MYKKEIIQILSNYSDIFNKREKAELIYDLFKIKVQCFLKHEQNIDLLITKDLIEFCSKYSDKKHQNMKKNFELLYQIIVKEMIIESKYKLNEILEISC
jgi:hypothetical protein